jgi:hypothetical protein
MAYVGERETRARVPGGTLGMPGPVWSLWAFATAGYRGRLGREKSPKGTAPTARGPSGRWGEPPRSIGPEGPP